jgi:hypothetical protein
MMKTNSPGAFFGGGGSGWHWVIETMEFFLWRSYQAFQLREWWSIEHPFAVAPSPNIWRGLGKFWCEHRPDVNSSAIAEQCHDFVGRQVKVRIGSHHVHVQSCVPVHKGRSAGRGGPTIAIMPVDVWLAQERWALDDRAGIGLVRGSHGGRRGVGRAAPGWAWVVVHIDKEIKGRETFWAAVLRD